jgi:hypothetical protein
LGGGTCSGTVRSPVGQRKWRLPRTLASGSSDGAAAQDGSTAFARFEHACYGAPSSFATAIDPVLTLLDLGFGGRLLVDPTVLAATL